jgi:hypothetical protein
MVPGLIWKTVEEETFDNDMHPQIEALFVDLTHTDHDKAESALLIIAMLIEKTFTPNKSDPLYALIIPPTLNAYVFSSGEREAFITRAIAESYNNNISLIIRVELISAIVKTTFIEGLEAALLIVTKHWKLLPSEKLRQAIGSITPQYYPRDMHKAIDKLLRDSGIMKILEALFSGV